MSISANGHVHDEANGGEDSDIESDFASAAAESNDDYYQPISADNGSESESEDPDPIPNYLHLSEANGNGIASLDLNTDDSESESEQEESVVRESEEDERRRRLQLSQERSERIMDVMRGIEFIGAPPPWAEELPEEQWLETLRRIRGETSAVMPSSST